MATPPTYPLGQAPVFDMGAIIPSASYNSNQTSGDLYAQHFKGITVILNVTSFGGASLTVIVEGKDSASGNYFPLLTSGAITSTGITSHTIYPGLAGVNTADKASSISGILPATIRVRVTVATGPATFSVGAQLTS